MAHFAELDGNNIVLRVIVIDDAMMLDSNVSPSEQVGIAYCQSLFGGTWLQTSYNTYGNQHRQGGTPFRKNYAGVGFIYDQQRDAFIEPQPTGNYEFNETTYLWVNLDPPENDIGVSRV
jgi:hypothetical protein